MPKRNANFERLCFILHLIGSVSIEWVVANAGGEFAPESLLLFGAKFRRWQFIEAFSFACVTVTLEKSMAAPGDDGLAGHAQFCRHLFGRVQSLLAQTVVAVA